MKVGLADFMSYEHLDLSLPAKGLVLVTGKNGEGKSSLFEAVAYACFGKTLRGTSPLAAEGGHAHVQVADLDVLRANGLLQWSTWPGKIHPPGATLGDTVTKAQERLETWIGTFDAWRRTRVFSSADAALFSQSTDGERKRLLESILGLERFDSALAACRAARKRADTRLVEAQGAVDDAARRYESAARRAKDAEALLRSLPAEEDEQDLATHVARLESALRASRKEAADVRRAQDARNREVGRLASLASASRARLERLQSGECPECGQYVVLRAVNAAESAARVLEAEEKAAREKAELLDSQDAEIAEETEALQRQLTAASARHRTAASVRPLREASARAKREALVEAEAAAKDKSRLLKEAAGCQGDADTLSAVEEVLGLRGVRAHVLGRALSGVEAVANRWLSRLGVPMRVSLKPHTEKKGGGLTDAISLEVGVDPSVADAHRMLGGVVAKHGYRAASSGQRRRVDIALLLALSEVSSAAHQSGPLDGMLFLDEVFDAVDADGQPAVARCLEELAEEKLVVVVTHSESLRSVLRPDLALHVEAGRVEVVT